MVMLILVHNRDCKRLLQIKSHNLISRTDLSGRLSLSPNRPAFQNAF